MDAKRLEEIRDRAKKSMKHKPTMFADEAALIGQDIPDLLTYIGQLHHALQLAEWVQPTCAQCGNLNSQGHENGCIYELIGGSRE